MVDANSSGGAGSSANPSATPPGGVKPGTPANGQESGPRAAESSEQDERSHLKERAVVAERKLAKLEQLHNEAEKKRQSDQGEWEKVAAANAAERDEALGKWATERKHNALFAAGAKAGARDLSDLLALATLPKDLDLSDSDALRSAADTSVAELVKAKPYLFGQADTKPNRQPTGNQPPAGAGSRSFDPTRPPTSAEITAMTPEQFSAYRAAKGQGKKDIYGRPIG